VLFAGSKANIHNAGGGFPLRSAGQEVSLAPMLLSFVCNLFQWKVPGT
jgi:hypothetical protein